MSEDRAELRADEYYLGVPFAARVEPDKRYEWPLLRRFTGDHVATIILTGRDAWLLGRQLDAGCQFYDLDARLRKRDGR